MVLVHIEGDFADSQPMTTGMGTPVKGCPFMRKNPDGGGIVCAIYATRPRICRDFRCYRMVIVDHEGHERGRIMGRNDLKTTDKTLERIWKEQVAPLLPSHSDVRWEKAVMDALAPHGYLGNCVK